MLLYPVDNADEAIGEHEGYVAGRQAGGYLTSISTDVRVHLDDHYVAYVPRCECGWTGPTFSTTPSGFAACERLWREKHLEPFLRAREPRYGRPAIRWTPRVIHGALAPATLALETLALETLAPASPDPQARSSGPIPADDRALG